MELGKTKSYNPNQEFEIVNIPEDNRLKHTYLIGKSGMGKSTLLLSMLSQDIEAGRGVAFFDPHGEDAKALLELVPSHRIKDVVYFNPADRQYPVSFNPCEWVEPSEQPLVADMILDTFKHLWRLSDVSTPQLEQVLFNAISAVIDTPDGTLLSVKYLLTNTHFRNRVLSQISDPEIKSFWEHEFGKLHPKEQRQLTQSTLNKVGRFLSDPTIRNIVAQPRNRIHFDDIINTQKIFIANLSQAEIGEDKARLLGGVLMAKLSLSAMKPHPEPFHIYIDEFQQFASSAFPHLLSTIRKFNVSLTLAHQYIDQLSTDLKKAVFGNVGTIITFRLGHYDAELLAPELELTTQQITNTDPYTFHVKTLECTHHSVQSIKPPQFYNKTKSIIKNSRNYYTRDLASVTLKIKKFILTLSKG